MQIKYGAILLFGGILYATAFPQPDKLNSTSISSKVIRPYTQPKLVQPTNIPENEPRIIRERRFTDRSQNNLNGQNPQQERKPEWEVKPDLNRDQRGNTNGQVTVQKHGENYDLEAGWGKTIRGPNKHSETWHAGGSIRW